MLYKRLFFILAFVGNLLLVNASTDTVEIDSISAEEKVFHNADSILALYPTSDSELFPKQFRDSLEKKYQTDEFDYSKSKPKDSIMDKIKKLIAKVLEKIFGNINLKYQENVIYTLAIIIIAIALYLIISLILKRGGLGILGTKNKPTTLSTNDLSENIHEINFPKTIATYEINHQYREAIRYQYLFVLKQLTDKNLIEWTPEKTNKDYVLEFNHPTLKKQFQNISYIFDYVWYGEFPIHKENYEEYKKQFINFIA